MDYWGVSPPMRFDELSYEEKRKFRYDLQDYMHAFFQFDKFSGKKILEVGSGAGIDSCEFARNGANYCFWMSIQKSCQKSMIK